MIEHNTIEIRGNSGFLIMSIDCLLIETLNQFYLGLKSTDERYYGRNWEAFRDFFGYSQYFPAFKDNDALSELFLNKLGVDFCIRQKVK